MNLVLCSIKRFGFALTSSDRSVPLPGQGLNGHDRPERGRERVPDRPARPRVAAWVGWLFLHLLYLAGFRNRLSALLTWGWSYITFDRSLRVVFDAPAPGPVVPGQGAVTGG